MKFGKKGPRRQGDAGNSEAPPEHDEGSIEDQQGGARGDHACFRQGLGAAPLRGHVEGLSKHRLKQDD